MKKLQVFTAKHRGFCAGVERAVEIVEKCLDKYGSPVFVRHEIVHNKYVVDQLKNKGVIFVNELEDIPPDTKQPVIFSAHGVAKKIIDQAKFLNFIYYDAICPLVSKIHREVNQLEDQGYHIVMIGHQYHPEVEGTAGQLKDINNLTLVESEQDVENLNFNSDQKLAYVTQTTLSIFDTQEIIDKLNQKYPNILPPKKSDICYATSNRQISVQTLAKEVEVFFVIGAANSSNSIRLVETARRFGCEQAQLIENIDEFDMKNLLKFNKIGVTASASAPEELLTKFIASIELNYETEVIDFKENENVSFNIPKNI